MTGGCVTFGIRAEDLRLLAEIGFLGIGRGQPIEAAAIFAFLRMQRPDLEAGHVGGALSEMALGRLKEAVEMLRVAPQTESVLAFRALAYGRSGDQRMAQEILGDLGFMRAGMAAVEIAEAVTKD